MRRTDLMDTKEGAYRLLLQRLRELTPQQRIRMTFDRIESARDFRRRTEDLRPSR
jgi:hypothetical protein